MPYETIPEKIVKLFFKYPFTSITVMFAIVSSTTLLFAHSLLPFVAIFLFMVSCFSEVMMDYLYLISKNKESDENVR